MSSNIGDLNKRITLQQVTRTPDGMGGFNIVVTDVATVWAAIWPVSANDQIQANATTMVITTKIRIRYRSVMKSAWRIKYGNRYFAIISIIDQNERHEWLDLLCKEAA